MSQGCIPYVTHFRSNFWDALSQSVSMRCDSEVSFQVAVWEFYSDVKIIKLEKLKQALGPSPQWLRTAHWQGLPFGRFSLPISSARLPKRSWASIPFQKTPEIGTGRCLEHLKGLNPAAEQNLNTASHLLLSSHSEWRFWSSHWH